MSTEKNTPDDDTQVVDAVDQTQPIDPVDETRPLPALDAAPVDQTVPLPRVETETTVDETEPLPVVETETDLAIDQTRPLEAAGETIEDEPTRAPDPFDVFTPAPAPSTAWQAAPEPVVVVEPPAVDPQPGRRRLRVGTVVWGLVLAACGLGVIAWASGARIDFELALIVLLAAAGAALLVGSIVSGARHARR